MEARHTALSGPTAAASPAAVALRGAERLDRVRVGLEGAGLAAIVCTLPTNVLLLSGYWPVVGTACAVVWRTGPVLLIVPPDEQDLATAGWADVVWTLTGDAGTADALQGPLRRAAERWGGDRIGVERGPAFEPASYAAMCVYGASLLDVVTAAWGRIELRPADPLLAELRAHATAEDLDAISAACRLAAHAFARAPEVLCTGVRETEAAAGIRARFGFAALAERDRGDGFVYCMSGVRSADAYRAYARSSSKPIGPGELVLVHCNAYVNGRWTDLTRTYCVGQVDERQAAIYDAIFAARAAALAVIRPGVAAREVDRAAREVLTERGLGSAFKHATGHGVGFNAIDHDAQPRIATESPDVLERGMVCNIEPAIYLAGYGGARHCDVVAVGDSGPRVLTPFQASVGELTIPPHAACAPRP